MAASTTDTSAVDVAALSELEPGVPRVASVGRREIVLLLWDDEVFAVRNVCPHQSHSFAKGAGRAKVVRGCTVPGDVRVDVHEAMLKCPLHGWTFSVNDGICSTDPKFRVRSYPTTIRDGRVLVDMSARRSERGDTSHVSMTTTRGLR